MLDSARQGYDYQDILSAYFVAQELANGNGTTRFHFDHKKTPEGVPDKFDDLTIYYENTTTFIQIKYSNDENRHKLTKQDFSSSSNYDLALFDLFKTWKALHKPGDSWRVCLAWDEPLEDDNILSVIKQLPDTKCLIQGTICYQFICDLLWPEHSQVIPSWRALRSESSSIERKEFKAFLDCLVLEINFPKSTHLQNYSQQLEKKLARAIEEIGIGVYPNDHLSISQVAESLCTVTKRRRITHNIFPISCDEIAKEINIIQEFGGVEQKFPVDKNVLVATPNRIEQVISVLNEHRAVILTAEPGSGKSWFIENLESHLEDTTAIIKHYCYIALDDPLALKRITTNVLYGSLITQILKNNKELDNCLPRRYGSNLEQLNILLSKITKRTLLIIDGIDHIWRVYQKNRGGLTEDETKIINALSQLDISNPNISLLIVSQPLDQLAELSSFYPCTLLKLPEYFVQELLEKHAIPSIEIGDISLAQVIHEKSNGNALYCKYLVDYALINKTQTSFQWISSLPPYDFNLTSYYQYLFEQLQGDKSVPQVLCGADFSLTENELQEITHLGSIVSTQLAPLKPILKFVPAIGYSIYHESFKRFVINSIILHGASVNHLIYNPLIAWLETLSFFESSKAYGHLLKLYYEVDALDEIAKTISVDFIEKSLYYAQPFNHIKQNHYLQKASLQYVVSFTPMIIIAEQAKMISQISHDITDIVLVNYLKAIQMVHGDDEMYRVLWDGEQLLINTKDALCFLTSQTYLKKENIHWEIVPELSTIPIEILGFISIKLLQTERYKEFDNLIKKIYEDPKHLEAYNMVFNEVEWFCLYNGTEWITNTPYFHRVINNITPTISSLSEAVERIISNNSFWSEKNWEEMVRNVVELTKTSNVGEVDKVIKTLSDHNWFRNWLIYLIKITFLAQTEYGHKDVLGAFSYLIRDLDPFKGEPRACDLYNQLSFIKKSFHWGLSLCQGNNNLLTQCCELLEKVTNLTTGIQRSFSGPLTDEEYLELIAYYLPGESIIDKYEKRYKSLGTRRVYSDVARIAFEYACVLNNTGHENEATLIYKEGVQALIAYGFRNDRTLSEVLDCSVPFHQAYSPLGVEWFYKLYGLSLTVVMHTDGHSTSDYPIEWFDEFIKVYPDEALKFLISETIKNSHASWHQEDSFFHVLEDHASLFSPTQWFLLCRSIPLASSNKILSHGLEVFDLIDETLQDVFSRWLQTRHDIIDPKSDVGYPIEISTQYEGRFGITLKTKEMKPTKNDSHVNTSQSPSSFPTESVNEALAFLEIHSLSENHAHNFRELILSIDEKEEKKRTLRQAARSFKFESNIGIWTNGIFEPHSDEWLYFSCCLFVYLRDGRLHGLHYFEYLKQAYDINPNETMELLKEIVGYYLSEEGYSYHFSANLINALSILQVEETIVQELLQTTYQIVNRRLPYQPDAEINDSVYQGLNEFNRDEMVVAVLIARLKTLTTEKTQGIIWSLTYLAQKAPKTLIKPLVWVFSNHSLLLPIHRAILLQILIEHFDHRLLPDVLISQLINYYPSGYFLEDQYIRSFVNYAMELDENSACFTLFPTHKYDRSGFPTIHFKYSTLVRHFGALSGTVNAFFYKRDKIRRENISYLERTEKILAPIVSTANAVYEIVNSQYYESLKHLTNQYYPSYTSNLRFYLEEIIIQVGSITKRPSHLPTIEEFPSYEVQDSSSHLDQEEWVILALKEVELFGEHNEPKKKRSASMVITYNERKDGDDYAKYFFTTNLYEEGNIDATRADQPIYELSILDTLERSSIIYVSPYVIRELGLKIDLNLHNGFNACNDMGEVIIKMSTWKEDYYGEISDGTEVPRLEGVAVMIRSDYYDKFLALYQKQLKFVLRNNNQQNE